jgi:hypothetical protein
VSTTSSELGPYPRSLFYILLTGLVIRVLFIAIHVRPLISDEREYDQLAYNLATHASYSYDVVPTAYRPIGYPAIVGSVYFLAGHHPQFIKYLQAAADVTTAFFLFLLLAGYPARVRVIAAGIWVLFVPGVLFTNFLLSETFFTLVLVITAFLLTRKSPDTIGTILAGIFCGVLILMKPGVVLFLAAVLLVLPRLHRSYWNMYPALIAFLLVVVPWGARNYSVFGTASLSSNGGINLLIGNNPDATGAYSMKFDSTVLQTARGEFESDQKAFRLASHYITEHPGRFLVNGARKLARLFETEGGLLVWTFHPNPEDTSTRYAAKYRSIGLAWMLVTNIPYFLVILLGILGFLSADKDALWWLVASLFAGWLALHFVFFGGGRFHFPLIPFFAVYAAMVLGDVEAVVKKLSMVNWFASGLIVFLLISIWVAEGIVVFNG